MDISKEKLINWTRPLGNTEDRRVQNSIDMVIEAIENSEKLRFKDIKKFVQGSYANDTNVRQDSDVDINIMCQSTSGYDFREFKNDVQNALLNKFDRSEVNRKNKCINIKGNSYRVTADVVPTFLHIRFNKNYPPEVGTEFFPENSKFIVVNFPEQHIKNGNNKDEKTKGRFKGLTRIHKNLHNQMIEDKIIAKGNITSFLLECLVYNIPDEIMNSCNNWTKLFKSSIECIYEKTYELEKENYKNIKEVSGLLPLFGQDRKWSVEEVTRYLERIYEELRFMQW